MQWDAFLHDVSVPRASVCPKMVDSDVRSAPKSLCCPQHERVCHICIKDKEKKKEEGVRMG
eukprot:5961086-Prymnesium_polylepis.1